MCQFNIIVISPEPSSDYKVMLSKTWRKVNSLQNSSLNNNKLEYWVTVDSHCNCHSAIGCLDAYDNGFINDKDKIYKKLKRKKWSETKINKYIENKLEDERKILKDLKASKKTEAKEYIELFQRLKHESKRCGIFYHQFRGGLNDENISALTEQSIGLEQLTEEYLFYMCEDYIYWID